MCARVYVLFVCTRIYIYIYIYNIETVGKDVNATEINKCMAISVSNIRSIAMLLPRGG